jgi:hypothetical protein
MTNGYSKIKDHTGDIGLVWYAGDRKEVAGELTYLIFLRPEALQITPGNLVHGVYRGRRDGWSGDAIA